MHQGINQINFLLNGTKGEPTGIEKYECRLTIYRSKITSPIIQDIWKVKREVSFPNECKSNGWIDIVNESNNIYLRLPWQGEVRD